VIGNLLLFLSTAQAAGYYVTGVGIRGMGRAGAVVAGIDDLSAQYHNPAALIRLDRQVTLQFAGVHQNVTFDREDEADLAFDPVSNSAPPMPIPALGAAWHLPGPDLTVALGLYTPYAPYYTYPEDGPQRFTMTDISLLSAYAGPSVAWRPIDGLTLGLGVAATMLQIDQGLVTHVAPATFEATDEPEYDVNTRISVRDPFRITWNAGLLYEPGDKWAVGVSVVPPIRYQASGSLTSDFSNNVYYTGESPFGQVLASSSASDDDVQLAITMPAIFRAGVLVRPSEGTELEVDVAWERWSAMQSLTVTGVDLTIETTSEEDARVQDDVAFPLLMQDAWSLRIGGQKSLSDRVMGRAGLLGETSGVSAQYRSVLMPDGLQVGYGLGLTWWAIPDKLALDFGGGQRFLLPSTLNNAQVYQVQIDPLSGVVLPGKSVGDGEISAMTNLFGLGLNWTL